MKFIINRYKCPADYHLTEEQLIERVYDSLKLWQAHRSDISLDLAISHILNIKEQNFVDIIPTSV